MFALVLVCLVWFLVWVGCFGTVLCVGRFVVLVGFARTLLNLLAGCFSFVCYSCYYLSFGLLVFTCLLWGVLGVFVLL